MLGTEVLFFEVLGSEMVKVILNSERVKTFLFLRFKFSFLCLP